MAKGALVLLADSQLLFSTNSNFLKNKLATHVQEKPGFAVYIGASNGNEPAFYDMGKDVLADFGVSVTHFLQHDLKDLGPDQNHVPSVILLSGGDVRQGWNFLAQPTIREWLEECWVKGTLFIGISAGAIHLTGCVVLGGNEEPAVAKFLDFFSVLTLVHEEAEGWPSEKRYLLGADKSAPKDLLKIPMGSGVWVDNNQLITFGKLPSSLIQKGDVIALPYRH